ncbi:hypothetical protein [Streptomyces sp. NPDC002172]
MPLPGREPREAVVPAELAVVLHDERQSLAAMLHAAPSARHGLAPSMEERHAHHVEQAGNAVRYVVAAAYEVLASDRDAGGHPLVPLVETSSPILQQVRFARELLPRDDRTSFGKGSNGDNRRISG